MHGGHRKLAQVVEKATTVPLQDELDDILRYGAAELFADAVAANQQAQQAGPGTDKGVPPLSVCMYVCRWLQSYTTKGPQKCPESVA